MIPSVQPYGQLGIVEGPILALLSTHFMLLPKSPNCCPAIWLNVICTATKLNCFTSMYLYYVDRYPAARRYNDVVNALLPAHPFLDGDGGGFVSIQHHVVVLLLFWWIKHAVALHNYWKACTWTTLKINSIFLLSYFLYTSVPEWVS